MNKSIPKRQPHLMLLCGAGGVGKTSIAASLALLCALHRKKVLAFTIDPAQRLADTLGIKMHGDALHRVVGEKEGYHFSDRFQALMLDVEEAAANLISHYAPDSKTAASIRSNKIFRSVINHVIGSEEYVALGRVFQLLTSINANFMIVDTAPTKYALQFFEGPEHLLNVLDPKILNRILAPLKKFNFERAFSPQSRITQAINQIITALIGAPFIQEITELASALNGMYTDFRSRVHQMYDVFRDPRQTSILIVTTLDSNALAETKSLAETLLKNNMPLKAILLNQTRIDFIGLKLRKSSKQKEKIASIDDRLMKEIRKHSEEYAFRAEIERALFEEFRSEAPESASLIKIPFIPSHFTSMKELSRMHPYFDLITRHILNLKNKQTPKHEA